MATTLSTILTAYRTAIAAAGNGTTYKDIPEAHEIDDLPETAMHQRFELIIANHRPITGPGGVYGGGHMDYEAECILHMVWNPQLDTEAIHNTIADDLVTITAVLLKHSNVQTGQIKPFEPTGGFVVTESPNHNQIDAEGRFVVRFRETQDLT